MHWGGKRMEELSMKLNLKHFGGLGWSGGGSFLIILWHLKTANKNCHQQDKQVNDIWWENHRLSVKCPSILTHAVSFCEYHVQNNTIQVQFSPAYVCKKFFIIVEFYFNCWLCWLMIVCRCGFICGFEESTQRAEHCLADFRSHRLWLALHDSHHNLLLLRYSSSVNRFLAPTPTTH